MWAAVPTTPVVVTDPLTDLSAPTVIVLVPLAEVLTGGTSWLPASMTPPLPLDDVPAHPAKKRTAAPTANVKDRSTHCRTICLASIAHACSKGVSRLARR